MKRLLADTRDPTWQQAAKRILKSLGRRGYRCTGYVRDGSLLYARLETPRQRRVGQQRR